jgi:hypothetical protein
MCALLCNLGVGVAEIVHQLLRHLQLHDSLHDSPTPCVSFTPISFLRTLTIVTSRIFRLFHLLNRALALFGDVWCSGMVPLGWLFRPLERHFVSLAANKALYLMFHYAFVILLYCVHCTHCSTSYLLRYQLYPLTIYFHEYAITE